MKFSMPPIIKKDCKILILGSLPGERSLQLREYYAHPQNQFWKIMCCVLNEQMPETYRQKTQMLLQHNIGLWDIVHSAMRDNSSLDSKIKNVIPNDLENLLKEYKNIQKILLNGSKVSSLFKKHFSNLKIEAISVPSTSPAYASMNIREKTMLWEKAVL